jgi:hypothetical protein
LIFFYATDKHISEFEIIFKIIYIVIQASVPDNIVKNGSMEHASHSIDLKIRGKIKTSGNDEMLCRKFVRYINYYYKRAKDVAVLCLRRKTFAPTASCCSYMRNMYRYIHNIFIYSMCMPGLPPHNLKLKIGSVIILSRNINQPRLCKITRLAVKKLINNVIEATILKRKYKGEDVLILRIPLIPNDMPFDFKRLRFPVQLEFAMSINKS